jgi:hypothetical protein
MKMPVSRATGGSRAKYSIEKVSGGGRLNGDGCARVGTWSGGEVTPGLNSSLKSRTGDRGEDAKHEAIANFIRRYWLGLPRGRGTQVNVISLAVDSVTSKPKRNETEGNAEGNTKSNR